MVIKNQTALVKYLKLFGDQITIKPEDNVLDLGCANGDLLKIIHQHYSVPIKNLYGIDISFQSINRTKKIFPNVIRADIDKGIPYAKKFDIVFALDILEHLEKPSLFFAEINRILNNNGRLVLSTPNLYSLSYITQRQGWYAFRDTSHRQFFCLRSLEYLVKSNGLTIVKAKTISTTGRSLYDKIITLTPYGGQVVLLVKRA